MDRTADDPRLLAVLAEVPDPEIPAVSVLDLGMVRAASTDEVVLTPTYTGCPATLAIEQAVRAALDAAGYAATRLRTTLDPPWTTDWISEAGREKLRAYGIAPPPRGAGGPHLNAVPCPCPRCGSTHTHEISRFGSTPCKALWRCGSCGEPFDRFKCL